MVNFKILNIKNLIAVIFFLLITQLFLYFISVKLKNKKTNYLLQIEYFEELSLYFNNTGRDFSDIGLLEEIITINNNNLKLFIAEKFNISPFNIKFNDLSYVWNSEIELHDKKEIDEYKKKLEFLVKKEMMIYLRKKAELFKIVENSLKEDQNQTENYKPLYDAISSRIIIEKFFDSLNNDPDSKIFGEINLTYKKKKLMIIENIVVSFFGTLFLFIVFLNRKKLIQL